MADKAEYCIRCTTPENYKEVLKELFAEGYVWWSSRRQDINIGVAEDKYIVVYSGDNDTGMPKNIAHGVSNPSCHIEIKSETFLRKAKLEKLKNMKIPLICQDCGTEIFVDDNMVILKDALWLTHFKKQDNLCDKCIEKGLGRQIVIRDLKTSYGEMIPCNLFWLEKNMFKK